MEETHQYIIRTAAGDFVTEPMTTEIFSSLLRGDTRSLSSTLSCREDKGRSSDPYEWNVPASSVIAYRKLPK